METASKFGLCPALSCVYVLHKTSHPKLSRPSRAVTAKKCSKKCNARAELLFWLLKDSVILHNQKYICVDVNVRMIRNDGSVLLTITLLVNRKWYKLCLAAADGQDRNGL